MRSRIFAVLAVAILAGGGLAYGTYNLVNNQAQPAAQLPTTAVVVAATDLPLGAALEADDLRVVQFPQGQTPEGVFSSTSDLVGRGVIAPLVKNEPIIPAKLASKEAGAGLPPIIPKGQRAVSVRVDDVIGVAGYVLPGTRVDVLTTVNPSDRQSDMTTKVILSNVQVLAAGTRIDQDTENKPVQVTVVTLVVAPDQAERLALASTEGKIQLALRNPLDQGTPETPGIKKASLVGPVRVAPARRQASAPKRSKPGQAVTMAPPAPAPLPTVEMIRGDKRAQEVIK
ncbi:MAG: Flp pilus assembly protein CpaB [Vicinamibacterales bacterium]